MKLLLAFLLLAVSVSARSNHLSTNEHSYYNTTFVKVIMTEDIRVRDVIYSTPAVVFIGNNYGKILRCLQEDPQECELFYKASTSTNINAFVLTGEYLYVALESQVILRCNLYEKMSCKTHWTAYSPVVALAISGGYLHAGYPKNSVWRCDLLQPESCQMFHEEKSPAYSFVQYDKYIYAGLYDGRLIRCSLSSENSCILMYNMGNWIWGTATMGNRIFTVTRNGGLWNCSLTSEDTVTSCESTETHLDNTRDMAAFNGLLYVLNAEGVHICNFPNNSSCSNYAAHKESQSLAFAYSTFQIQSRYRNEDTTCTWQIDSKCPPYVVYFDVKKRAAMEVHVKDGKLFNAKGFLVDTINADEGSSGPAAIFAMGPDGRILLSNTHKEGLIHTSSFFAGNPVAGAGEMVVENGTIVKMNTCSEHYKPTLELNKQVIQSLIMQGYKEHIDLQECCKTEGISSNFTAND